MHQRSLLRRVALLLAALSLPLPCAAGADAPPVVDAAYVSEPTVVSGVKPVWPLHASRSVGFVPVLSYCP